MYRFSLKLIHNIKKTHNINLIIDFFSIQQHQSTFIKFPYFGQFSYYAIFSKNNTILDIRVPFKAFKRRKKILHVRYFILRHLHLII